jgi:hypothetical protein
MSEITRFAQLFAGYDKAFGTYSTTERNDKKGGKLEIKKSAKTLAEDVTYAHWENHITGSAPLGIIPINEKGECHWACIDYDAYDLNHSDLVKRVDQKNFPLILCRSKSGGAHLFVFFKGWERASDVITTMRNISAQLGLGNAEIFPKQSEVLYEKGDFGSWLNLPYFGDSTRQAIRENGMAMSLKEFLNVADRMAVDLADIEVNTEIDVHPDDDDQTMKDGPPCLQFITRNGVKEGQRNKALTNLAVFAKKKYSSDWQNVVVDMNQRYFDPPLDNEEVQRIIKSVDKKDYRYACKDTPLCDHCVSRVCITRRYGVGDENAYPVISGLSVLNTDPRLWFLDVGDQRIDMDTETLMTYRKFHALCVERLFVVYPLLKQETWNEILRNVMDSVVVIDVPDEVSIKGVFRELLIEFQLDMVGTGDKGDILRGRVWLDDDSGNYHFRLQDLTKFLERRNFKGYSRPKMITVIREFGGDKNFVNINGTRCNVWTLPPLSEDAGPIQTPETHEDDL